MCAGGRVNHGVVGWVSCSHTRSISGVLFGPIGGTSIRSVSRFTVCGPTGRGGRGGVGETRVWEENEVDIGDRPAAAFLLSAVFVCRSLVVSLVLSAELTYWG